MKSPRRSSKGHLASIHVGSTFGVRENHVVCFQASDEVLKQTVTLSAPHTVHQGFFPEAHTMSEYQIAEAYFAQGIVTRTPRSGHKLQLLPAKKYLRRTQPGGFRSSRFQRGRVRRTPDHLRGPEDPVAVVSRQTHDSRNPKNIGENRESRQMLPDETFSRDHRLPSKWYVYGKTTWVFNVPQAGGLVSNGGPPKKSGECLFGFP